MFFALLHSDVLQNNVIAFNNTQNIKERKSEHELRTKKSRY